MIEKYVVWPGVETLHSKCCVAGWKLLRSPFLIFTPHYETASSSNKIDLVSIIYRSEFPKAVFVWGFAPTDAQTVYEKLKFRTKLYKLREERDIPPQVLHLQRGMVIFMYF